MRLDVPARTEHALLLAITSQEHGRVRRGFLSGGDLCEMHENSYARSTIVCTSMVAGDWSKWAASTTSRSDRVRLV